MNKLLEQIDNLENVGVSQCLNLIKEINECSEDDKERLTKKLYEKIEAINLQDPNYKKNKSKIIKALNFYKEKLGGVDWAIDDLSNFAGILMFGGNIKKGSNDSIGINSFGFAGTAGLIAIPTLLKSIDDYKNNASKMEHFETTLGLTASLLMLGNPALNLISNFTNENNRNRLVNAASIMATLGNLNVIGNNVLDGKNKRITAMENDKLARELNLTLLENDFLEINKRGYLQYLPNVLSTLGQGIMAGYNTYNVASDLKGEERPSEVLPQDAVPASFGPALIILAGILSKTLCKEVDNLSEYKVPQEHANLLKMIQENEPLDTKFLQNLKQYGKTTRKFYTQESEKEALKTIVRHYFPQYSNKAIFKNTMPLQLNLEAGKNKLLKLIQKALESDAKYMNSGYIMQRTKEDGNEVKKLVQSIVLMNAIGRFVKGRENEAINSNEVRIDMSNFEQLTQNIAPLKMNDNEESRIKNKNNKDKDIITEITKL